MFSLVESYSSFRLYAISVLDLLCHTRASGEIMGVLGMARTLSMNYTYILIVCSLCLTNRTQGAMLCHVKPEDLLDYADYRRWQKIHRKLTGTSEEDFLSDSGASKFELAQFEAISAQAWTHILCQLIKVLYRRLTCL